MGDAYGRRQPIRLNKETDMREQNPTKPEAEERPEHPLHKILRERGVREVAKDHWIYDEAPTAVLLPKQQKKMPPTN